MSTAASAVAATKTLGSYDEILKGYLVKALEQTGNLIDKSVDIVMQQAPILVQEMLHWYFAYDLIKMIIGMFLFFGVIGMWYYQFSWGVKQSKMHYEERSKWYEDSDYGFGRIIFMVMLLIPFVVGFCLMNLDWLKIYIAPRLWLIEYTANLVKSAGH